MNTQIIQLTESTWLFPHHPDPDRIQPSIGIITSDGETLLVDVGNSPSLAEQVKDALIENNLPEVTHIVYTHHHWDHVSGACSFDVPIIAHETCQEILLEEAKKPWNSEYLREEIKRNPKLRVSCEARERAIKSWEGFRLVIPDRLFARSMQFRVGNIDLWFEHVGGNHAVDSIIVKVPAEGIMFLGDCYYPPPLHLREPTSTISKIMLASIENKGFTLYVEGHDDPFTRAELLEFLDEE